MKFLFLKLFFTATRWAGKMPSTAACIAVNQESQNSVIVNFFVNKELQLVNIHGNHSARPV